MAIVVKWDNAEKDVLVQTFEELWTWKEFYASYAHIKQMMDSVVH